MGAFGKQLAEAIAKALRVHLEGLDKKNDI